MAIRQQSRIAPLADANHILYLVRANQLFIAGHKKTLEQGLANVTAKSLFLPSSNDLLLMPYMAEHANAMLNDLGKQSELEYIEGPWGHLNGLFSIQSKATKLTQFLNQ